MNKVEARNKLTPQESKRFQELLVIVDRGVSTFVETGHALAEISDLRYYRETHDTFKAFVEERYQISVRRAYELIEASDVIKSLPADVRHDAQINPRQARELAKVPAESRADVITEAAKNGKVTAKSIRQAAVSRVETIANEATEPTEPRTVEPEPETAEAEADRTFLYILSFKKWLRNWPTDEIEDVKRTVLEQILPQQEVSAIGR